MDNNQYNTQQETVAEKHLFKVTNFSKLLALILLITLPFIGFWVGIKYMSDSAGMVESKIVSEEETEKGFTKAVKEYEAEECLSSAAPKPLYNNTRYSIVYSPSEGIEYDTYDGNGGIYPYDKKCKVSLVQNIKTGDSESGIRVIVDDLAALMIDQGLSVRSGLPQPYIFYNDNDYLRKQDTQKLVFGGNNYEGSLDSLYSLDVETLIFKNISGPIGEGQIDRGGNPFKLLMPYKSSVLRVLDLNTEKLYESVSLGLSSTETLHSSCERWCSSSIGWVDRDNIWYGIYEYDESTNIYTFKRLGHIEYDPDTWKEVKVEQGS